MALTRSSISRSPHSINIYPAKAADNSNARSSIDMSAARDLRWEKFGHLAAIEPIPGRRSKSGHLYWLWHCERCGEQVVRCAQHIIQGHAISCGCWKRDLKAEAMREVGRANRKS